MHHGFTFTAIQHKHHQFQRIESVQWDNFLSRRVYALAAIKNGGNRRRTPANPNVTPAMQLPDVDHLQLVPGVQILGRCGAVLPLK